MRNSIIMSVYNRSELVLLNTLMSIAKNDPGDDTEVIIVNDGSDYEYGSILDVASEAMQIKWIDTDTQRERPETYSINGHNNPAYVMNLGFEASEGENVAFMSSDVIIPPHTLNSFLKRDLKKCVATPKVVDMDTFGVFCGAERVFPVQWFLISARENWLSEDKPVDENYLKGIAFEDNDMSARIALKTGKVVIDQDIVAYHQSHEQIAYSDEKKGFEINRRYCEEKWEGAIPWSLEGGVLDLEAVEVAGSILVNVEKNEQRCVQ